MLIFFERDQNGLTQNEKLCHKLVWFKKKIWDTKQDI